MFIRYFLAETTPKGSAFIKALLNTIKFGTCGDLVPVFFDGGFSRYVEGPVAEFGLLGASVDTEKEEN